MRYLAITILSMHLVACTTVQNTTRVTTSVVAREYNSVAAKYLERPTFAAIENMSDGAVVLSLQMDRYGGQKSIVRFLQSNSDRYVSSIEKFSDWESLAKSRGDAFTKEISRESTWGNTAAGSLKFQFHSGSAQAHYLTVSFCAAGTCLEDQAQYFDAAAAKNLTDLLKNFGAGKLVQTKLNAVYK